MTVYRGSDGRYYSDEDVWVRLERESWRVFCWNTETGVEVMENDDGELVFLAPVDDEREETASR